MDCNKAVHVELLAYRAQVQTHETYIQTRDARIGSLETLVATLMAQTSSLQTQLTTALGRIQTLEAREPACTDDPEDAGVVDALAEHEANRSRNGDDSHDSGTGRRRTKRAAREYTYSDFLKRQPLNFKGTEGVVGLTQCHEVAYGMTWKVLKKMMTDKYCPRGEIKKLEIELWNLKVKGTDVLNYNQHFQELALMCSRMFPEESNEVEKYVSGLPDMIQGSNVARAYTARTGEKKVYGGSKPLCPKCNYHHAGQCALKYNNCKRASHLARDYRSLAANANANNQRAPWQIRGLSLAENGGATTRAYAVGNAGKNLDANVVTGTFLLNNRYDSILFDTGADRSFMSTLFSSLIDIVPTALDHDYDVELAEGNIIGVNTIIRGCTLNFLNYQFNIDLMPIEIGSLDIIIGMDWLVNYHAVIVCDENTVRIPFGNEILIIRGDGSNNGHESRLNIISYTKTQKYLLNGYGVFLAHVTTKKAEYKSEEKRLEDVPIVRDFLKYFPRTFRGDKQEAAFQLLKENLCSAPILALPEGAENFIVYCDAHIKD
ncbi:putative reverse transcriptase domain-containing protein [Tanacetum coccineum]|uniref:Reverse transcriptase domain-containing protein n=1 Tax=Tanacetum coccineum TaxID=301880 RepID=A0ABQ4YUW2_9ASTR